MRSGTTPKGPRGRESGERSERGGGVENRSCNVSAPSVLLDAVGLSVPSADESHDGADPTRQIPANDPILPLTRPRSPRHLPILRASSAALNAAPGRWDSIGQNLPRDREAHDTLRVRPMTRPIVGGARRTPSPRAENGRPPRPSRRRATS